jgi:hypothetical protein
VGQNSQTVAQKRTDQLTFCSFSALRFASRAATAFKAPSRSCSGERFRALASPPRLAEKLGCSALSFHRSDMMLLS